LPGEKFGAKIEKNSPTRVALNEKERQFLDAFKIVIASGYTVNESDFMQILQFINITEVKQGEG
jgi:hypothetical protein